MTVSVIEYTPETAHRMASDYAALKARLYAPGPEPVRASPEPVAAVFAEPEPAAAPPPATVLRNDPLASYRHAYEVAIPPDMQPQIAKQIILETAQEMGVYAFDIIGACRVDKVSMARAVAMWRVADKTSMSLTQIGNVFNKDHSTVIHAIRRMNDKMGQNVRNMGGIRNAKILSWQKAKDADKARREAERVS